MRRDPRSFDKKNFQARTLFQSVDLQTQASIYASKKQLNYSNYRILCATTAVYICADVYFRKFPATSRKMNPRQIRLASQKSCPRCLHRYNYRAVGSLSQQPKRKASRSMRCGEVACLLFQATELSHVFELSHAQLLG